MLIIEEEKKLSRSIFYQKLAIKMGFAADKQSFKLIKKNKKLLASSKGKKNA